MRITDWRIALLVLLFFCAVEMCFAGSTTSSPLLIHKDPQDQKEFQNLYSTVSRAPSIFISSGTPGGVPQKVGDIDVSTGTSKVFVATATVTSNSWALVN